jgi:hypothetical protein
MEKIDQTIDVICERIQSEIKDNSAVAMSTVMSEWIKSLAALITARANLNMSVRVHESKRLNQNH